MKSKVVVVHKDPSVIGGFVDFFEKNEDFYLAAVATTCHEGLLTLKNVNPDLLICGFSFDDGDVYSLEESCKCQILVCENEILDSDLQILLQKGVIFHQSSLFDCLFLQKLRLLKLKIENEFKTEQKITSLFFQIGIPSHLCGYNLLRDAVKFSLQAGGFSSLVTRDLYPKIAQLNGTTASKAERAIRNAIGQAWALGAGERVAKVFGQPVFFENFRPTNSEFIATLTEFIRLEF